MRAGGAWYDEVVARRLGGLFVAQFGTLLLPAEFHHLRQAMDHDVQKTADH